MKDFISRQVTFESDDVFKDDNGEPLNMKVVRWRTSNGAAGIIIEVDGKQIRLEQKGSYESIGRELVRLLDKACDNPCMIPKVEP